MEIEEMEARWKEESLRWKQKNGTKKGGNKVLVYTGQERGTVLGIVRINVRQRLEFLTRLLII